MIDAFFQILTSVVAKQSKTDIHSLDIEQPVGGDDDFDMLNDVELIVKKPDCQLICRKIFNSEYLLELFLGDHCTYRDHKQLRKLSRMITDFLSTIAKQSSDISDVIDLRYVKRLITVIDQLNNWTQDLISVVDGFWSVLPSVGRCRSLESLVSQPTECVTDDSLNSRGELVVRLLKVMTMDDWTCMAARDDDVIRNVFEIVKCIPSECNLCDSLNRSVALAPSLLSSSSHNHVFIDVIPVLLKNGSKSALTLVTSLLETNPECQQTLVDWLRANSKRWMKPKAWQDFTNLILSTMKSFKQGGFTFISSNQFSVFR